MTVLMSLLPAMILLFLLAIIDLVLVILAAVKASNGEVFRYPLTIKFLQ
ncbi:MAG: DUF4870 domain-containing protein [Clostridia bacterium]|nr:DUF4870 domain-containing protein [Clostridia bacterium]